MKKFSICHLVVELSPSECVVFFYGEVSHGFNHAVYRLIELGSLCDGVARA